MVLLYLLHKSATMSQTSGTPEIKGTTDTDSPASQRAFSELEDAIIKALQTYSNVHRGSGHFSRVSTHLYEKAREIVLNHLKLDKQHFVLLFLTPARATAIKMQLNEDNWRSLSSRDLGLPLGIEALAVSKKELYRVRSTDTGGGTTKLTSRNWVIWDGAPDRYEAGTPAVINAIAFAKALMITEKYGKDIFKSKPDAEQSCYEILLNDGLDNLSGIELLHNLRTGIIGKGVKVPVSSGEKPFINLDSSASTPAFSQVWETYRKALRQPSGTGTLLVNEVKAVCSDFLSAPSEEYEFIFTSNTTEALNILARNQNSEVMNGIAPVVVNSVLEHSSNDLPWRYIEGAELLRLNVDKNGFFDTGQLTQLLEKYNTAARKDKKRITLVALTGASNVLGTCNNIREISDLVHKYDSRLLVDAAQLVAHRKINMFADGIDYLAFSAHKIYAPFGSGLLVARKGLLNICEEERQAVTASGEENYPGVAALGKSLLLLNRVGFNHISEEESRITARALTGMKAIKGMKLYGICETDGEEFKSKLGVIPFNLGNEVAHTTSKNLALHGGIGIRSGCHCAHIIVKRLVGMKPVFENIQWLIQKLFPKLSFPGVGRVSFGIGTTDEDIEELLSTFRLLAGRDKRYKLKAGKAERDMQEFIIRREKLVFG